MKLKYVEGKRYFDIIHNNDVLCNTYDDGQF